MADKRMVEKQIWYELWSELHEEDMPEPRHHNNFYDDIKSHFADLGRLRTDAKTKRFEEAMQIVRRKIWKMVPRHIKDDPHLKNFKG
jgi:hypothetical protein